MTSVVVCAIAVIFAIRLVVLLVVGHEIVEREAVMTGDKIHVFLSVALLRTVDLGAADQSVSQERNRAVVAPEKAAHIVTKTPVPLSPLVSEEVTHLVQTRRIPGLGDELRASKCWVGVDVPQHGRPRKQTARFVSLQD